MALTHVSGTGATSVSLRSDSDGKVEGGPYISKGSHTGGKTLGDHGGSANRGSQ